MKYDTNRWTYGYELELSDTRRLQLPEHFGRWEHSERDIVNTRPPYRGIAADPLGENPPVGGEINTHPSRGWEAQSDLIIEIVDYLKRRGEHPTVGPTAHGHIHVHIPGLTEDIDALKRLTAYVVANQKDMVEICGGYVEHPDMDRKAREYFKRDGGRLLPAYIAKNIQEKADNFESFIKMHAAGKDGKSMGRPFRYAINMYCLKHTKTIEFRMFRGTLDRHYLRNSFHACELFLRAALEGGPAFKDIIRGMGLTFAPMQWDKELWDGLQRTKHPEGRGKKERRYVQV